MKNLNTRITRNTGKPTSISAKKGKVRYRLTIGDITLEQHDYRSPETTSNSVFRAFEKVCEAKNLKHKTKILILLARKLDILERIITS